MNENTSTKKARGSALLPFAVFIVVYLGAGIILDAMGVDMAFYQFPSPVAALIGIVVAFIMFKGTMDEKFSIFAKGCGNENILTMCFIYLFADAFATVAKAMGGVDSTVNLGLSIIPAQYITGGMFIISAFIGCISILSESIFVESIKLFINLINLNVFCCIIFIYFEK